MAPPALPTGADAALRRFRQFYGELFAIKRLLREGDWSTLLGGRTAIGNAGGLEERVMLGVRLRLRDAITALGFGGPAAHGAPAGIDPGYVWTAVADASLLHDLSWPGRDGWASAPLEVVLYRTRVAGDRVFQAADELLHRRAPDPDGLAMTILLALAMGYRGRYYGSDDRGEIERLKNSLFNLIFQGFPSKFDDFEGLTVGAVDSLVRHEPAKVPTVRPWGWAIFGVVFVYLITSRLMWWSEVSTLADTAARAAAALSMAR